MVSFWESVSALLRGIGASTNSLFFKGFKMCRGKNHKCACRSSCCDKASLVVAYDERGTSSDDSDSDISITPETIKVK